MLLLPDNLPSRASFLWEHMNDVVDDRDEILALELDPELSPREFFQIGDELRRSGSTPSRPYYLEQRVFPYTAPGEEPSGPGEDLADVVLNADRPILLTGLSGSGKTLLTRSLFWRILRSGERADDRDRALEGCLFVRLNGDSLRPISPKRGVTPGVYRSARHVAEISLDTTAISDEQVERWVDNSPTIIFVFDLNRADTNAARLLLDDIFDNPTRWKQHRFCLLYTSDAADDVRCV